MDARNGYGDGCGCGNGYGDGYGDGDGNRLYFASGNISGAAAVLDAEAGR